jgi:hypothetical protein
MSGRAAVCPTSGLYRWIQATDRFRRGSGPDIFIISPGDFLRYYNGGVLVDLTPNMEDAAKSSRKAHPYSLMPKRSVLPPVKPKLPAKGILPIAPIAPIPPVPVLKPGQKPIKRLAKPAAALCASRTHYRAGHCRYEHGARRADSALRRQALLGAAFSSQAKGEADGEPPFDEPPSWIWGIVRKG